MQSSISLLLHASVDVRLPNPVIRSHIVCKNKLVKNLIMQIVISLVFEKPLIVVHIVYVKVDWSIIVFLCLSFFFHDRHIILFLKVFEPVKIVFLRIICTIADF